MSLPLALTRRQWRVLMLLNRFGPSTSGQIAANSPQDPSQASSLSYELAEMSLISLHPDPSDRRKQTLRLTPAATDLPWVAEGLPKLLPRDGRAVEPQITQSKWPTKTGRSRPVTGRHPPYDC